MIIIEPESILYEISWIPAFAGMTAWLTTAFFKFSDDMELSLLEGTN